LDAIEDFMKNPDLGDKLVNLMKPIPDLERLLCRVHSKTARLSDFLNTLNGIRLISV